MCLHAIKSEDTMDIESLPDNKGDVGMVQCPQNAPTGKDQKQGHWNVTQYHSALDGNYCTSWHLERNS